MPFAHPIHRTLILVAQPEYLATDDLLTIREKIARQAPDVHVVVVGRADRAELISAAYWQRPAVTVSFGPMGRFRPLRGRVFANEAIPKLEQYRRLAAAGVATPRTAPFQFGMELPNTDWGELCVLKPADIESTSSGRGLYLFRARRLAALMQDDLPPSHFARSKPMIVQSFVDTGARFSVYRCLTLFGEVIYQNLATAPEPHPPLASDDQVIEGILPEPPRSRTTPSINTEPDVMTFAAAIHAVFPDMPLLGCDIVREHATGQLYAIEVNAGGNVWHLSSPRTSNWRSMTRIQDYLRIFQSYDKAALALIRTVRRHAS